MNVQRGIKRGDRRKAIMYRSISESGAYTSPAIETLPPPLCPGQRSSSCTSTECNSFNNFEHLKESIMKEIRMEMTRNISPLIDKVEQLVRVVQTLAPATNTETSLNNRVRAECRTNDIVYGTSEPRGLVQDSTESEDIYHDASKMATRLGIPRGIDNQIYGLIPGNTHEPSNQKQQTQCTNRSNGFSKPKDIRSTSLQTRVKTVTVHPRPRSAIHIQKVFDERDCLENALQFCVQDIVDGLIFRDSELPDVLVADGCLTEDECLLIRDTRDRKDRIRFLLTRIKCRDLHVLNKFLNQVQTQNSDVARKILDKFEKNKTDGVKRKLCALCKLENLFSVKDIADGLWSIYAIDAGLYNMIIHSDLPVGAQSTLWKKVIQSLNMLDAQKAEQAHNKLKSDLSSKDMYVHLAEGVKGMLIKNHGKLTCSCEPKLILPKRNPSFGATTSAESNLPDSMSEGNSNDSSSIDGAESVDIPGNVCRSPDEMSVITEANESTPSPSNDVQTLKYVRPQEADKVAMATSDNMSSTSIQTPTSMEKLQSTHPDSSTIIKKPVPPVKPTIPSKKPDIKQDVNVQSIQMNTNISTPSNNINIRVTDSKPREEWEDRIPPLPKKKNQTRKAIL